MKKKSFMKTFLIWVVLCNWPPILMLIPAFRLLCFIPCLLWVNIPALWLGMAKQVGKPHFDIQEFGALPLTPFSWLCIVGFWLGASTIFAILTMLISKWTIHRRYTRAK